MATLDQLRALFPDASSDADLITQASKEFGISPTDIAGEIGYKVPKGGLTSQQFSSSIDKYQAGLYGVAEEAASGLGAKGVSKWARGQREENELQADIASQRARDLGAVDTWKDVHGVGDFGSYAKGMAIQSLPYAGEALAGGMLARGAMSGTRAALTAAKEAKDVAGVARAERALNLGSEVGGVAASYPSAVGDVLSNQREQAGETRGGVAAALGVPYAALNAVGVEGALMKGNAFKNTVNILDRSGGLGGALSRTAATGAATALKEGASETGQEVMNQFGRMAVDKNEQLFSDAAQERFKESFIGGATLGGLAGAGMGGWRRSGNQPPNDVSQAMASADTNQPDVTTQQFQAPVAPAPQMREQITEDGEIIQVPVTPAVAGGSTEIAQAQQQAQAAQQQQEAQAQQAQAAEQAAQQFGVVNPATPAVGSAFGQKVYGPNIPAVANAIATFTSKMPPQQVQLAQAITQANAATGGQLIKFKFNANDVMASVDKGFQAVGKVANQFQIAHVESVDEAAAILDDQSTQLKGDKLEQVNAIHQALTGQNTTGFEAAQQPKGAKNDKLQLQTDAGLREVPVQGGAGEASVGGNGSVRPTEVQPLGAGSVGEGPLGLQVGQPPTSGVRTSTDAGANTGISEPVGSGQGQGQVNVQAQPTIQGAQEVTGERYDNAAPETLSEGRQATEGGEAVQSAEEQRVEGIPDLITLAMRQIFGSDKKVALLKILMKQRSGYQALADDFGFTLAYVKELAGMAKVDVKTGLPKFLVSSPEALAKFRAACEYQAEKLGVTMDVVLQDLEAIDTAYDASPYGNTVQDEDLVAAGLAIQNREYRTDSEGKSTGKSDLTNITNVVDEGDIRDMALNAYDKATEAYDENPSDANLEIKTAAEEFASRPSKKTKEAYQRAVRSAAALSRAEGMQKLLDESEDLSDADRANLEKQIAMEWQKYANIQAKEETPTQEAVKEPENAVQKRSTKKVPVQERAGSSKALGEGNTEGGQAAAESEAKVEEPKQEVVVLTPAEKWETIAADYPLVPPYESLTKDERVRWDDLAARTEVDVTDIARIVGAQKATQPQQVENDRTIDGTGLVREITPEQTQLLEAPVSKLTEGQTVRLERHYSAKRGSTEFLTKLHDDIALYAAKGAAAVNAAVRDIIKAVYTAVLAVAVVFNPTYMNKAEAYTFSPTQEYSITKEIRAEAPAEAAAKMSPAAKEAYATLMPALKAELVAKDKLLVMADKPSGRIFVFTPDGKLVLEKKSLFGLSKGDFYKGNNDLPANRVTPAGLHNIVMVDAAKGGSAAKTAGEYDFGKVFGIVDKNPGVLTIMHSVWLKETDAPKRAAALKSESAADSRYSFGCINVDKVTYKDLLDNHGRQMDGAKLFVVPDNQERLKDFVSGEVAQNLTGEDKLVRQAVTPVTETTTGVRQNATQTATERTIVGKEEEVRLASKSAPSEFMTFEEAGDQLMGLDLVREQLEEAGIGHAVDLVSDWELTNDSSKDAEHGSLRTVQGRYVGTLNMAKLMDAGYAAEVARHEIAHAIDMGPHGGVYSAQPEMGVSVVNGKINAEGPVSKELFNLYKTNAKWKNFLAYPFDSKKHPELNNRTKVQLELFAQAFSIYTTPEGRAIMEAQAPVTAAYFKEVIQDVKSTKPLQIQKAEIAALRSAVLYTRRESKGDRGPSKLLGFDERVDELLASRSEKSNLSQPAGVFSKAGEWLDGALTSPKETFRKLKLGFLTLDQLAELDKTPGQVVRGYSDVMTAMQKLSKDMVYKASQIDQLWAKLSTKDSDAVSQVMRDATRAQFDPSLSVAGKSQAELDIANAYRALPANAKDVYAKVKKYYEDAFQTRLAIMEESAAKLGGKELKDIQEAYSKLKGPYFPLGRTGRYYAVGMSPRVAELTAKKESEGLTSSETTELAGLRKKADQYKTSSFNSLYDAKKASEKFKAEMGSSYYNEVEENIETAMSKMPNFAKLEESITARLGGETRAEVTSMLSQLMFDALPEHHALKNQMRREGIYGENEDMRQVFAQTSISQAHYISRLQFGGELNNAMLAIAKAARQDIEMRQIQNELKLRTKLSMDNTQSALTDAMVNASYFAHLGLSPAFLLTNMTQVPMITAPWLGSRHGMGATKRAMAMALADTAKIIKSSFKDGDWRSEIDWTEQFPAGSNEDRMFRDLLDRNVLDITMEHDLAAVASAQKGLFDDKISKATNNKLGGMSDVVKLVNTPVRITELANRAVTALSAYRLKMEALATAPMTAEERHTAAVNYAARAVSETQLNYSELNAPRHMRQVFGSKPLAKMIFQFRKYQQGMLYLIAKNISDSLPGSKVSKEDRRIARRTIAGLYMTTGLMAGTTGMPLMGTVGVAGIANLIAAAFGDDDEPWDFETEYRNFLTDWLGHDMALLVAKGLPAYLGADLSKRVGMGDIANPIPFVQRGATGQSTVANTLYAAGGAPIGMVGTMYDGIVAMANGDVLKGMEKVIPVKAVKDALRTYRYADEGMTDKRGNVILAPEKFDAWDLALRGMGFTPTKESEYYAANAAMQEAKTAATDVRTRLLREYSEAKLKGEPTADVDAKIVEFNERHPEKSVKIDMSTKLKSVQARRKMAAERTESGLRVGKYEKPFAGAARFAEEQ